MDRVDWAPSPADVGTILRARTVDVDGNELGTFDSNTRPSGDECYDIIETIQSEVAAYCGPIPDQVQDYARRTAAYGAAAEVELTYWPEQVSTNRSPYDRIYARYQSMLTSLRTQVADINAGDDDTNDANLLPVFGFDQPCGGLVGWSTRL